MLAVRGVGAVGRVGGVTREVRVELDPARLLALNVTAAEISRQLREVQQEAPGGRTDLGGAEQSVRTIATVQTARRAGALEIAADRRPPRAPGPGGDGHRRRGRAALGGAAQRQAGGRLRDHARARRRRGRRRRRRASSALDAAEGRRTPTSRSPRPSTSSTRCIENYDGSMILLLEGAMLAVLVVWFFLRDWRATLVVGGGAAAVGDPDLRGDALHGLHAQRRHAAVAVARGRHPGRRRHRRDREHHAPPARWARRPLEAAMEAADEIGLAVIATTFTLIAVFLPTAFMSGVPGKFFVQFGWTAAIAVFFSLVVARMLTPMMAAYMLHAPKKEHPEPRWMPRYMQLGGLVPEAPRQDAAGDARCSSVGFVRAGASPARSPAPSSRRTTCRRPRSTSRCRPAAPSSRRCAVAEQARDDRAAEPARQAGLHRGRRRQRRRRPVRAAAARPRRARPR